LRVDPAGAVEILVEQAVPASEIDAAAAKSEQASAEAELAKWGDKPQDGDYANLVARSGWAQARVAASTRAAH
jgi:F0F1-type ATP synthase epsilon subunit